jgi:hypothetical protein
MPSSATVTIRETFERPSSEYPQGSYLFRVGSRFVLATGRFEGLAEELDPEGFWMLRLATIHRTKFISFGNPTAFDFPWAVGISCKALVKEGLKALMVAR